MCYLLIYLRPLLLNEPFVVTVETSVRITIEPRLPNKRETAFSGGPCKVVIRKSSTGDRIKLSFETPACSFRIMVRKELGCAKKTSCVIRWDGETVINPLPGYD
jgi:hypothetical protein